MVSAGSKHNMSTTKGEYDQILPNHPAPVAVWSSLAKAGGSWAPTPAPPAGPPVCRLMGGFISLVEVEHGEGGD